MFTASRVDILDNGSLKLQYNRNRYYDQYTGRWLTHDPPAYVDGISLYEYCSSKPLNHLDALGARKAEWAYPPGDQPGLPTPIPPGDWIKIILKDKNLFGPEYICGWVILKDLTNLKVDLTWKDIIPFGCAPFRKSNENIAEQIAEYVEELIQAGKKAGEVSLTCKKGYCCSNKAKFDGEYHATVQLDKIRIKLKVLPLCEVSGTISADVEFEGKVGECVKK